MDGVDNICYANGFRTDGVLDNFLKSYELFDQSKSPDIKGSSSDLFLRPDSDGTGAVVLGTLVCMTLALDLLGAD